jgi:uncharacterized XkdX family phage protein
MEHSKDFERIKGWFLSQNWNEYRVGEAVKKGKITAEEYEEITGKPYER